MGFPGVWGGAFLVGFPVLEALPVGFFSFWASGGTFWVLALMLCWLVALNLCVPGRVEG